MTDESQSSPRVYVFTWITPWMEESIPSKPSEPYYAEENEAVTVKNLPTSPPSGDYFIRGIRLYRSISSASGTEFFLLQTLWFPNPIISFHQVGQTQGGAIVYFKTQYPHKLGLRDRFLRGSTGGHAEVSVIENDYVFGYYELNTSGDIPETPITDTLYYDVSESLDKEPRFWGWQDNWDFIDDFDSRNLFTPLLSEDYDPPPADLRGLTRINNNILVGFVGNALYFSEPNIPSAWPRRYKTVIDYDIVALVPIVGSLLVLTNGYPYMVSTNDPAGGISVSRIDFPYPCVSKKSAVSTTYGVVWASTDGLISYTPSKGIGSVTKLLYDRDTWAKDLDPTTIIACHYSGHYFASHSNGSFIFTYDEQTGGYFVDIIPSTAYPSLICSAMWTDLQTNRVYYIIFENLLYEWDDPDQTSYTTIQWKSKVFKIEDMVNFGAARVIADYEGGSSLIFRLWVDKELIYENTITDSKAFRLPTGYRSDTFEVGVEGNIRVRAIHLAETMLGLEGV